MKHRKDKATIDTQDYKQWQENKDAQRSKNAKNAGRPSKLSSEQRAELKRLRANGYPRQYLAEKFDVSVTTIRSAELAVSV